MTNAALKLFFKNQTQNWKEIFILAWPLIIANGFWIIQTTVDRVFLAQYSTNSLAAATAVNGIFWAPMALVQHTAAYSMTFTAQYFGARQFEKIGSSIWQAFYISLVGGTLFLLLIPAAPFIFGLMGHSEELLVLETSYFIALCLSAAPFSILGSISGFFAGIGKSKYIIPLNVIGVVANALFNYLLIFGNWGAPEYGITGAGYATALSTLASCVLGLGLLFNRQNEALYRILSAWMPHWDLLKRYVRFGIPSALQYALEGFAFSIFLILIGRLQNGNVALASSGVTLTIFMLAVMPVVGIAQAASVLVGQYIGRDLPERAASLTHSSYQIGLLYTVIIGASFVLLPNFYLSWFSSSDASETWSEVVRITPLLLIFTAAFIPFDCMNIIYAFALKGAGDTKFVGLMALFLPWPTMVIPTYFILNHSHAVYWAWGFASFFIIVQGLCFLFRFQGGKWKKMKVI